MQGKPQTANGKPQTNRPRDTSTVTALPLSTPSGHRRQTRTRHECPVPRARRHRRRAHRRPGRQYRRTRGTPVPSSLAAGAPTVQPDAASNSVPVPVHRHRRSGPGTATPAPAQSPRRLDLGKRPCERPRHGGWNPRPHGLADARQGLHTRRSMLPFHSPVCLRRLRAAPRHPVYPCMLRKTPWKRRLLWRAVGASRRNTPKTHLLISTGCRRPGRFSAEPPPLRGLRRRAGALYDPGPRKADFPKMPGALAVASWTVPARPRLRLDAPGDRWQVRAPGRQPGRTKTGADSGPVDGDARLDPERFPKIVLTSRGDGRAVADVSGTWRGTQAALAGDGTGERHSTRRESPFRDWFAADSDRIGGVGQGAANNARPAPCRGIADSSRQRQLRRHSSELIPLRCAD